jgi:hypothetical protein
VVLIALLAGCSGANSASPGAPGGNAPGGTNGGQAAPPKPDAGCTQLISDAEMQKITKIPDIALKANSGQPNPGEKFCPYNSDLTKTTVILGVFTGEGVANTYTAMDRTADSQQAKAVTGVGDSAKWADKMSTLLAKKGQTGISVMVQNPDTSRMKDLKKTVTEVAKTVVGRVS